MNEFDMSKAMKAVRKRDKAIERALGPTNAMLALRKYNDRLQKLMGPTAAMESTLWRKQDLMDNTLGGAIRDAMFKHDDLMDKALGGVVRDVMFKHDNLMKSAFTPAMERYLGTTRKMLGITGPLESAIQVSTLHTDRMTHGLSGITGLQNRLGAAALQFTTVIDKQQRFSQAFGDMYESIIPRLDRFSQAMKLVDRHFNIMDTTFQTDLVDNVSTYIEDHPEEVVPLEEELDLRELIMQLQQQVSELSSAVSATNDETKESERRSIYWDVLLLILGIIIPQLLFGQTSDEPHKEQFKSDIIQIIEKHAPEEENPPMIQEGDFSAGEQA